MTSGSQVVLLQSLGHSSTSDLCTCVTGWFEIYSNKLICLKKKVLDAVAQLYFTIGRKRPHQCCMLVYIALAFFTEILIFDFWTDVLMITIQSVSTSRNQWTPTDNFTNVLSTESGDFLSFDFRYTVHWTILPVDICIDSYWTICAVYYCIVIYCHHHATFFVWQGIALWIT